MRQLLIRPAAQADLVAAVRWHAEQRFPYRVFFIEESDRLVLIAVLHVRREPVVWQRRSP